MDGFNSSCILWKIAAVGCEVKESLKSSQPLWVDNLHKDTSKPAPHLLALAGTIQK